MEDTIEICVGCGKMPRPIDYINNQFVCSRCGSSKTRLVNSEDYEKVATSLDDTFHKKMLTMKIDIVKREHGVGNPSRKSSKKKAVKKKAKKAVKKKTAKKAKKKPKKKLKKKVVKKAKKPKKKAVKKKSAKKPSRKAKKSVKKKKRKR